MVVSSYKMCDFIDVNRPNYKTETGITGVLAAQPNGRGRMNAFESASEFK
jgi:hypothetical protein